MASALEQAMQKRVEEARKACLARDPAATEIEVAIAFSRCIVDYKDKDGEPHRFEHQDDIDVIGALAAEQQTQRREVVHGVQTKDGD
jgi:hypothetical protein